MIWILALGGGLVSGMASSFIAPLGIAEWLIFLNPIPGICFAALLLLVMQNLGKNSGNLLRKVLFVIFSIAAYIAAFWATLYSSETLAHTFCYSMPESLFGRCDEQIGFFIGGVAGALILILSAKFIFKTFTFGQAGILIVSGGILGILGVSAQTALADIIEQGPEMGLGWLARSTGMFPVLFMIWQVGMVLLITYFLKRNIEDSKINVGIPPLLR